MDQEDVWYEHIDMSVNNWACMEPYMSITVKFSTQSNFQVQFQSRNLRDMKGLYCLANRWLPEFIEKWAKEACTKYPCYAIGHHSKNTNPTVYTETFYCITIMVVTMYQCNSIDLHVLWPIHCPLRPKKPSRPWVHCQIDKTPDKR